MIEYTAVIRTLGKAGYKYFRLLESLNNQTYPPKKIIVYIAEGYPLPEITFGNELYVYVKKGMVAQRALQYDEVTTEYILFLDDDLEFPPGSVIKMFQLLEEYSADVVSPDIFKNSSRSLGSELIMTISGRMRARRYDDVWGYKIMRTGGYSYNKSPKREVYKSQTNAGACFLCRKEDFLKIHFEEELWLDLMPYALGEDQVMYYKMYSRGLRILTWYNHEFKHLDAGDNMAFEKEIKRAYCDLYFKIIFWHRFIQLPEKNIFMSFCNFVAIIYYIIFMILTSWIKGEQDVLRSKKKGIFDACKFIRSEKYKKMPLSI